MHSIVVAVVNPSVHMSVRLLHVCTVRLDVKIITLSAD